MENNCFHCGLPVPKNLNLPVSYQQKEHKTCCVGCQAVATAIIEAGLDHYYTQRTKEAVKAELPPPELMEQIKLYDLDEIQKNFVITKEENKRKIVLMLEGITCAACVWLIEQRLIQLNGLISVEINYSTHKARVVWDNDLINLSNILEKIAQTGYQAYPYDISRHEEITQKERRRALMRLWVAGLSMMQVMMYVIPTYLTQSQEEIETPILWLLHWTSFILTLPVMLYSAVPFYQGTIRDLKNKRVGMDTPVTIAILAAFLGSTIALFSQIKEGVFFDSISMFVFLLLGGRYLESLARRKAGDAAERLMKLTPTFCHKLTNYPNSQETEEALVAQLQPNDTVLIKSGEIICVDGPILSGSSNVDESMLTGESVPINKSIGSFVTAGTLNIDSPIIVTAEKVGLNTRVNAIVRLLDKALSQKPRLAILADRFASWFVAILLLIAFVTFVGWSYYAGTQRALWVTVSLLVISCPCALSLATPAALAASTGNLARKGLLISRGHALETLSKITDVVFDKTGTLTEGKMSINQIWFAHPEKENEILSIAAALEKHSNHPIACTFHDYSTNKQVENLNNIVGQGIDAHIDGENWRIGKLGFVEELISVANSKLDDQLLPKEDILSATKIYLGSKRGIQAVFYLTDTIKTSSVNSVQKLKNLGFNLHLLSGDIEQSVRAIANKLEIEQFTFEATPEDKLAYIENLQNDRKIVLMVGDGINDAPVLASANISIAIGSGSDIAREGGDMVLLNDDLDVLPQAWQLAKKTKNITRENLIWASIYNLAAIPLAISGHATPAIAALGMAISSIFVVSNSLRLLK